MTALDLVPLCLAQGRAEGQAAAFRSAAENLRAVAKQLDEHAAKIDEQAKVASQATEALAARMASGEARGESAARRLLAAFGAARATWRGGR